MMVQQAGGRRPRRRRPHPRGGNRLHRLGPAGRTTPTPTATRRWSDYRKGVDDIEGGRRDNRKSEKRRSRPGSRARAGAQEQANAGGRMLIRTKGRIWAAATRRRGGRAMRPEGCEARPATRILASMPFLDRQEMVAVSGWSRGCGLRGGRRSWRRAGSAPPCSTERSCNPPPGGSTSPPRGCGRLAGEEEVNPSKSWCAPAPSPPSGGAA